jgi:restriction system protein
MEATGRCFVVLPDQGWERIGARNGLLLLRRVPPVAGEPPLFFRPADVAPAGPGRGPAPAPASISISARPMAGGALLLLLLLLIGSVLVVGLVGLRRFGRWWTMRRRHARALGLVSAEIAVQRDRLQVRRLQLVSSDDYGTVRVEKWQAEKRYFCKTRLLPLLTSRRLEGEWSAIEAEVLGRIERAASAPGTAGGGRKATQFESDPRLFDPRMDPIDYEHHCAILLRQSGWDAQVTAASGDQGADVLARRNGALLVVQCKLYRGAVGNASVQQVSAARLHHRARFAAVVSNARFTASAVQLARTNGVYLLHHDQLKGFQPA